jgi:thiol:disulfide interchange protein DsbA
MRGFHRFFVALALFAGACFSAVAADEPFQAGRDYEVLPQAQEVETGDKIELREFFWYGCPHCYVLEGPLSAYVKRLPKNVRFVRTPGVAQHWLLHAQTYYAFEAVGLTEKLHKPFFDAWHAKNLPLTDEAAIVKWVGENGGNAAQFKDAFNSFGVRARLDRAKMQNINFGVEAVPTLVVDGRYKTTPNMAGGKAKTELAQSERTIKVLEYLIQKAEQDRKKAGH